MTYYHIINTFELIYLDKNFPFLKSGWKSKLRIDFIICSLFDLVLSHRHDFTPRKYCTNCHFGIKLLSAPGNWEVLELSLRLDLLSKINQQKLTMEEQLQKII